MEKNNHKYFTVNASEITKKFILDDGSGYPDEVNLSAFFNYYEIPQKYHQIVLEYNDYSLKKHDAEEFITGLKLYKNSTDSDFSKFDTGETPRKTDESSKSRYYNKLSFQTYVKFIKYDEVVAFYKELEDNKLLERYINALMEAFDYHLDAPLIIDCYNKTNDRHLAKKLYRQRTK